MTNFTSPCLSAFELDPTAQGFKDLLICPYDRGLTVTALGDTVTGTDLFFLIISIGILAKIYQRTDSFGFTAVVALICGTAMIYLFPQFLIKVGIGLIAMAFAGLLVKLFTDRN